MPDPERTAFTRGFSSDMSGQITADDLVATFDAFNRHDIAGVMRRFADDCVFYTVAGSAPHGTRIEGAEAIAKAFEGVWTAMPDAHWDHRDHFVHGDRAVSEWTFSGTGADGARIELEGADLFRLRDGEITVKQALRKQHVPG